MVYAEGSTHKGILPRRIGMYLGSPTVREAPVDFKILSSGVMQMRFKNRNECQQNTYLVLFYTNEGVVIPQKMNYFAILLMLEQPRVY
jgi:hypothetical protein